MAQTTQDKPQPLNGRNRLEQARAFASKEQLPSVADLAHDYTKELIRCRVGYTPHAIVSEAFMLASEFREQLKALNEPKTESPSEAEQS